MKKKLPNNLGNCTAYNVSNRNAKKQNTSDLKIFNHYKRSKKKSFFSALFVKHFGACDRRYTYKKTKQ